MKKSDAVSAVVITKNEENTIARCLESLSWADETVVVDCGSSDDTVKTAKKYGAKVYYRKWAGFAAQKNFAISKARYKWVLSVDADEIVTGPLKNEIISTVKAAGAKDGYSIPRRNHFYGKWLRFGGLYPDRQVRLFKNGRGHFPQTEIHESLHINGETGAMKNPMIHNTKETISAHLASINSYSGIEAAQRVKGGKPVTGYTVLIRPVFRFIKHYFFKGGILDGVNGLIYHALASFELFAGEIKALELAGFKENLKMSLFKRAK